MTDQDSLASKLSALIAPDSRFVGAARVISQQGAPHPMAAVLAEIDTTVLERRLVFDIDGRQLHLVVAGRRLRGVLAGAGIPQTVADKVLSAEDATLLRAVGDVLAGLCRTARLVTVQSLPAPRFGTPSEVGVSATALAGLWQGAQDDAPQDPLLRFLLGDGGVIVGFLHSVAGNMVQTGGDTAGLQAVWQDQTAGFLAGYDRLRAGRSDPLLVVLDTGLPDGRAVGLARIGGALAVFAYDAAQAGRVLALWRACILT